MKREQALELNGALNSKDLKVKHVSGENYLKILKLKTKLKNELELLGTSEVELAKEFNADITPTGIQFKTPEDGKEFLAKRKEIFDKWDIEVELNFLPQAELLEYVKEQDTAVAAVLYEYLRKQE
jgi:hypothetical protein